MDGTGGIVLTAALSFGVNAVGWGITLWRSGRNDAQVIGAVRQQLEDICKRQDEADKDIKDLDKTVRTIDTRVVEHIAGPGHNGVRRRSRK